VPFAAYRSTRSTLGQGTLGMSTSGRIILQHRQCSRPRVTSHNLAAEHKTRPQHAASSNRGKITPHASGYQRSHHTICRTAGAGAARSGTMQLPILRGMVKVHA